MCTGPWHDEYPAVSRHTSLIRQSQEVKQRSLGYHADSNWGCLVHWMRKLWGWTNKLIISCNGPTGHSSTFNLDASDAHLWLSLSSFLKATTNSHRRKIAEVYDVRARSSDHLLYCLVQYRQHICMSERFEILFRAQSGLPVRRGRLGIENCHECHRHRRLHWRLHWNAKQWQTDSAISHSIVNMSSLTSWIWVGSIKICHSTPSSDSSHLSQDLKTTSFLRSHLP